MDPFDLDSLEFFEMLERFGSPIAERFPIVSTDETAIPLIILMLQSHDRDGFRGGLGN